MAEATSVAFTLLQEYAGKAEAFVTATVSSTETITLDYDTNSGVPESAVVTTILHADGQDSSDGSALVFSYATNVLTLTTGSVTDADAHIRVLYE